MALYNRNGIWYAYFRTPGSKTKQKRISLGTSDRKLAEAIHATIAARHTLKRAAARLSRNLPGFLDERPEVVQEVLTEARLPVVRAAVGLTLGEMEDVAAERKPLSRNMREYWRRFVKFYGAGTLAAEITPQMALHYLDKTYSKGNGKSWNNAKCALNGIYKCCLVQANMATSPFAPIVQKRVTEIEHHRNLTDEEIARLMEVLPPPLRVMMLLSRYTTLRLKECARVTPDLLDREKQVLIIDPGKNKRFDEWVCVPLVPELLDFLDRECPDCPADVPYARYVWGEGEKWPDRKYSEQFLVYARKAGVLDTSSGKASFHSLRGSAITWFKDHGVHGEVLSDITGQDTKNIERLYARSVQVISQIAHNWR